MQQLDDISRLMHKAEVPSISLADISQPVLGVEILSRKSRLGNMEKIGEKSSGHKKNPWTSNESVTNQRDLAPGAERTTCSADFDYHLSRNFCWALAADVANGLARPSGSLGIHVAAYEVERREGVLNAEPLEQIERRTCRGPVEYHLELPDERKLAVDPEAELCVHVSHGSEHPLLRQRRVAVPDLIRRGKPVGDVQQVVNLHVDGIPESHTARKRQRNKDEQMHAQHMKCLQRELSQ